MTSVLRLLALAALAVWAGGLVTLGTLVAPVLFETFEARDGLAGRETAGWLFGSVFREFQYLGWAMAGVLLVSLGLRAALGPRPQRMAIRTWTVVVMLAASLGTSLVIIPRIEEIRTSTTGPVASLEPSDPVRAEFGRLHGLANGLALVILIGGVGLIWAELRDQS